MFTSDYRDLITVLLKDLARRNISAGSTPALSDNAPNTTKVIDYIVSSAKKLGYSTSEAYGLVSAGQMERIQQFVASEASRILVL